MKIKKCISCDSFYYDFLDDCKITSLDKLKEVFGMNKCEECKHKQNV